MIKSTVEKVMWKMIEYSKGEPKLIQHFTKVHRYAQIIGECEGLSEQDQLTLEIVGIVHDIGIIVAMQKYGHSTAKLQETEGPAVAKGLLDGLNIAPQIIDRVAYLVSRHHTYTGVDGVDYQILLEADFLVNFYEEELSKEQICHVLENVFKTQTGIKLCETFFEIQ